MTIQPINGFPTLSEIQEQIASQPKQQPPKRSLRRVLLLLIGVVLVLGISQILRINLMNEKMGTGTIIGILVGEDGQPVSGEVTIQHTTRFIKTDKTGHFSIERIPTGSYVLIAAFNYVGKEIPINIPFGGTIDLGKIQVDTIGNDFQLSR